jgi:thioredoxin reductase (NADPH)
LHDVIVLGSGPAGLTAALYASRALLKTLVVAGSTPGGQLTITSDVENFPGFPEGVLGPDLMALMRKQVERFGAEVVDKDADKVDFRGYPFKVVVEGQTHIARALIIATGAQARWLGLPGEEKLKGRGVSSCATCDGYFFRGKEVMVVGGGDSAMEEALFLTRFASKVTVIHRRDKLRASKIMQDRAFKNPKIRFQWNGVVEDVLGENKVEAVKVKDVRTGKTAMKPCDGFFVAIGHEPNTGLFVGQLQMDDRGYILTQKNSMTSVPGVFVAGDVHDHRYRQAITAAGDGCRAAMDAEKWLEERVSQVTSSEQLPAFTQ